MYLIFYSIAINTQHRANREYMPPSTTHVFFVHPLFINWIIWSVNQTSSEVLWLCHDIVTTHLLSLLLQKVTQKLLFTHDSCISSNDAGITAHKFSPCGPRRTSSLVFIFRFVFICFDLYQKPCLVALHKNHFLFQGHNVMT